MKRGILHPITSAVIALSPLLLTGCGDEADNELDVRPAVSAVPVAAVDLVEQVRASGELKAVYHTIIAAEIDGRVTEIRIEEGTPVDAGTVVIEIDPERRKLDRNAAKARLAQARAELAKVKSQTERVRKLGKQDISSEQQIEEAETALLLARANAEAERAAYGVAERALADASVGAPFAGHVAEREVQLGQFVQKGDALFELVSLDPLEVEFSVPELDSNRIRDGQRVDIEVGAWPDRHFEATVKFVSPTIDPETRTLRVRAQLENTDGALRPGLFARVSLGVDSRRDVVMVPEEALIQRADGALLFKVLPDARVKRVAVVPGSTNQGLVEVTGDVRPGERVVRLGHGGLTDGAMVRVIEDEAASAPAAVAAGKDEGSGAGL